MLAANALLSVRTRTGGLRDILLTSGSFDQNLMAI
jgi:hypothetical protein